ncbi:MAG: hypothetical protein KA764_02830 [Anaerolineales bacterium]|nr:hypothetical protein [Anaerolineales bacterium]
MSALGLATVPPRRVAAGLPSTPYPTSTPYRSPTPTLSPTATRPPTQPPTATPLFTPTATPAPVLINAENAGGWRAFAVWQAGDPGVLAALSPDGQTAVVYEAALNGLLVVDVAAGVSQAQTKSFLVAQGRPLDLGYTGQQALVLLANEIQVWDFAAGGVVERLSFFPPPAREMRLSPDREWVAVRAKYLTVYHRPTKRLYNLGDQGANQAYAFSPDGRYVALAVGTDVDLYSLATGRVERTLPGRNKAINSLVFTADSARVVAASGDVWEAATGRTVATFNSPVGLQRIAVSANAAVIAGGNGEIWALDGAGTLPLLGHVLPRVDNTYPAVLTGAGTLEFVRGGELLLAQAPGEAVRLYAVDTQAQELAGGTPAAGAAAALTTDPIGSLNLPRLGQRASLVSVSLGMDLSADGARVLTWNGANVAVTDLVRNQLSAEVTTGGNVVEAAFLAGAEVLALVKRGPLYWVELWDTAARVKRSEYGPYDEKTQHLAVSGPAGVFAVQGKYIQIVDVATGELRFNLGSADSYQPFVFTPDGRYLAIASRSVVTLWDMQTGQPAPGSFGGHGPEVTGLAFTPDGRRLAASSGDVWEVATRRRLAAFDPAPGVALSPDGALAVAYDGAVWDAATGQYLGALGETARRLAFTPDGRGLVWYASPRSGAAGPVMLYGIQALAAHVKPAEAGLTAPERWPLTAANIVSATVLGWWGADAVLERRLILDPAQPQAANFGPAPLAALTLSPDARTFTALTDTGVELLDPATGALVDAYQIFLNPETVTQAAYLGADLLLLKARAGVERWNLAEQTLVQRYNVLGEGLEVSPDGRWFALRQDRDVVVVEAAGGTEAYRYRVQAGAQEYQFSPDSRSLAVTTGLFVEFYDLATGQRTAQLRGRSGRPFGIVFAPDGRRLYAASGDAWSLPDGQPLFDQRLALTTARLALSPDGALLVEDNGAVWSAVAGQRLATLANLRAPAVQLLFAADGRQLLWRTADGRVYTWAVRPPAVSAPRAFGPQAMTVDNAPLFAITRHLGRGRLRDAVWSLDERYLAVNTTENALIYAGATLEQQAAFLDAAVLTFDAQGRALIGGLNHSLQLVEVETGAVVKDYQRTGILAAAFSPDGARLALGGRLTPDAKALDGVAVIDPDGVERTFAAGPGSYTRFTGLTFTSDGAYLVVSFPGVNTRGSIWLWDVANGSRVREPITGNTLPAAVSPDDEYLTYFDGRAFVVESLVRGGRLFTISADGAPYLPQAIDIPTKYPLSFGYLPDGELLVFYQETNRRGTGLIGSSSYVWTVDPARSRSVRLRTGSLLRLSALTGLYAEEYARDREAHTPVFGLGPAGKYFYSLTGDGVARVWDYGTGRELARTATDSLPLMALSPDGRTVAVPAADGALEIRVAATGVLETTLPGSWYPAALAYASDSLLLVLQAGQLSILNVETGQILASAASDLYSLPQYFTLSRAADRYALWNRSGGRTVLNIFGLAPERVLFSLGSFPKPDQLSFSPDGRLLAVARGRTVELWDLATRQVAQVLAAQGRAVGALAFSPDGARLYAATGEMWALASGTLIATFDSQASAVLLSPDGQVVVGNDGTLWNAEDGLLTGNLAGRGPAVNFAFTPDGERLLWQGASGLIEIWTLRP